MMFNTKKGVSVWISYVILIAMVVSIGMFVFQWSTSQTEKTVSDIVARGDTLIFCESVSLDIQNLCQDTQTLNMDVTNNNVITVDELFARMFDIYDEGQISSRIINLDPQKSKNADMLKQGIVNRVELMPIVTKNNRRIRCESRKLEFDDIPIC